MNHQICRERLLVQDKLMCKPQFDNCLCPLSVSFAENATIKHYVRALTDVWINELQETSWNLKLQLSKRERETPLTLQGQQSHWFCYPPDSSGSGWTEVCRIDASYDIMIEYS